MKKPLIMLLSVVILITACVRITSSNPATTILELRAYIDGRSQIVIKGNTVHWHHLEFDAPGRWEFAEAAQPTYLNQKKWDPTWPDFPDRTNDSCNCDSSIYEGIPGLARTNQRVWLDVVQGRGRVAVIQQPDANNSYTLILELDDNYFDGAEWYEVRLNYKIGAPY